MSDTKNLRNSCLFAEHPLVFIEAVKIRLVYMIQRSDTQTREETLQELERPLEAPNIGEMTSSTPASVDLCQVDFPKE